MTRFPATATLLLLLAGCTSTKPTTSYKELDFAPFTIQVPATWEKLERRGIDSYVGGIILDQADTAFFDLGMYSYNLSDDNGSDVSFETIDGYKSKLLSARPDTDGLTGIYIDSLSGTGGSRDRFNLYGRNLSPSNRAQLLKAIRTLKFKNRD